MGIIIWLIVGGIVGWLASLLMKRDAQQGILLNIVVGIVGAVLAGWIFGGGINEAITIRTFLFSIVGAVILLAIVNLFTRDRHARIYGGQKRAGKARQRLAGQDMKRPRLQVRATGRGARGAADALDIGPGDGCPPIGPDRAPAKKRLLDRRQRHERDSTLPGRALTRDEVSMPAIPALSRSPGMKAVTSMAASVRVLPITTDMPTMPKA